MVWSSFLVGVISSTITSVIVYERVRDRGLLCEKKFDDSEIRSYTYKMVFFSSSSSMFLFTTCIIYELFCMYVSKYVFNDDNFILVEYSCYDRNKNGIILFRNYKTESARRSSSENRKARGKLGSL